MGKASHQNHNVQELSKGRFNGAWGFSVQSFPNSMSLADSWPKSLFNFDDSLWQGSSLPQNGPTRRWQYCYQRHLSPFTSISTLTTFPGEIASLLVMGAKAFVWSMRSSLVVVTVCTASLKTIPAQCRSDYRSLLAWGTFHSCVQNGLNRTHYQHILSKASVANTQRYFHSKVWKYLKL